MNTYEKLRSRIVELVPEIVELRLGCEVIAHNRLFTYTSPRLGGDGVHVLTDSNAPDIIERGDITKIIGRPITLEDVLMAMQRSGLEIPLVIVNYYKSGVIILKRSEEPGVEWHLGLPLEQQDEETLLFISKILEK